MQIIITKENTNKYTTRYELVVKTEMPLTQEQYTAITTAMETIAGVIEPHIALVNRKESEHEYAQANKEPAKR